MSDIVAGQFKLCLTSFDDHEVAKNISRILLQQKLVACVNISSPVASMYHWQDEIVEESEFVVIMKTTADKLSQLREQLLSLHPYDVPEMLIIDIEDGSTDYLNWINFTLS
ncbi:divalent-cation tolerance protein CutA [Aliikangiella sp. IMCC44359]|uniref:divalent-cation tolerance protein CutA n=1 Tax=Aliikangiella sp. IMCC44359 TaxID=3459125 RepID=UPI00403B0E86